jgi:hypothetical protein
MKKKIQAKSQSYLVGYRRPPKTHQFRKGHSGNPSGERKRPSNVPDLKAQLEGALNKTAINSILKESTTSLLQPAFVREKEWSRPVNKFHRDIGRTRRRKSRREVPCRDNGFTLAGKEVRR